MNNYELLFNIINTILSTISVLFIIFGWIIPYKQSQKQTISQRKYEESIKQEQYYKDKIDEQISKLYVPLYTLSMENKMQFNLLLKKLNRSYVFAKGENINDLSENDKNSWIDFLRNRYIPNLNRMKEILNNNIHLIYEPELPSSYQRFMSYTLKLNNDLELYLNSLNNNYTNLFIEDNYPSDFDIYINKTLANLLQLQRKQLAQDSNDMKLVFDANINDLDYGKTAILVDDDNSPFLLDLVHMEIIAISSSQFIIGTDTSCNLVLNSSYISRKHLMIAKEDSCWYIVDLNSENGVFLNGIKLAPNSKTLLQERDIIKIANLNRYSFHSRK